MHCNERHGFEGQEPTFRAVVAQCPRAALNPSTNKVVDKKIIYDALRQHCFDDVEEHPWHHQARLSKSALPPELMERRLAWGKQVRQMGHPEGWYFQHVIWTDLSFAYFLVLRHKLSDHVL